MKAENVTYQRDPDFFEVMAAATSAWLAYYSLEEEREAKCQYARGHNREPRTKQLELRVSKLRRRAEKLQRQYEELAADRGYDL